MGACVRPEGRMRIPVNRPLRALIALGVIAALPVLAQTVAAQLPSAAPADARVATLPVRGRPDRAAWTYALETSEPNLSDDLKWLQGTWPRDSTGF
jgi:hypothetical protein